MCCRAECHVVRSDDGRGDATVAGRAFGDSDIIFREPPLAIVFPDLELDWLRTLRTDLLALCETTAWAFCLALQLLTVQELAAPPPGINLLSDAARVHLSELCGAEDAPETPSMLALLAASRLDDMSGSSVIRTELARCIDIAAHRALRNSFQVVDMTARPPVCADALFHRISFLNHCCAGYQNATWMYDGMTGLLSLSTRCSVAEGEELTISYISKPWSHLSRVARQRYLQQNYNFGCLCVACQRDIRDGESARPSSLSSLMHRWLIGHDPCAEDCPAGSARQGDETLTSGPGLADSERLQRVLFRCEREGLETSAEEAAFAQSRADGHVGKTLIALRHTHGEFCGANASKQLSHDERVQRVMERCHREAVTVSNASAQEALLKEDGHVGKTMIRLRREQRQLLEGTFTG